MGRKLASIQKILSLSKVENADTLEKAIVLGWVVVVKVGEFKVGDLCVFCEVDSKLPDRPEFEFLRAKKFKVKTIRLRGVISQGLCLPLSVLGGLKYPNDTRENPKYDFKEGDDVTALLGVTKPEPPTPAQLAGDIAGGFPSFVPKTDEFRIQSFPGVLERHRNKIFYVSAKVDGASLTAFVNNGCFGICSRNFELKETSGNAYWKAANQYGLKEKLISFGGNMAIQAELYGEGVQGNKLKQQGLNIAVFNVFDIDNYRYLNFEEAITLCNGLDLPFVRVIEKNFVLNHSVEDLIKMSIIKDPINPEVWAEGLVFRPVVEDRDEELGRLSFKVINPMFLLKYDE